MISPSSCGLSLSYRNARYRKCWREVIVVRRGRKSSSSFGTPAIVLLRELAAITHKHRTGHVGRFFGGKPQNRIGDFPRVRPSAEQAHFRAVSFQVFARPSRGSCPSKVK